MSAKRRKWDVLVTCACGCRWEGRYAVENPTIREHMHRNVSGSPSCVVDFFGSDALDVSEFYCRATDEEAEEAGHRVLSTRRRLLQRLAAETQGEDNGR